MKKVLFLLEAWVKENATTISITDFATDLKSTWNDRRITAYPLVIIDRIHEIPDEPGGDAE